MNILDFFRRMLPYSPTAEPAAQPIRKARATVKKSLSVDAKKKPSPKNSARSVVKTPKK